jgi:hypothetical protein
MSDAIVPSPVPQAEFHAQASAAVPWYVASAPEQQALMYADYSKAAGTDIPLAEYLADVKEWPSMAEYLADAGMMDEQVPSKAADVWVKYARAVDSYAVSESAKQLDVGRWAQAYLDAYVGNETDAGVRKSRRAAAVKRCQDYLTDTCTAGVPVTVDRALRLWAVGCVYGKAEARTLGIGKLRAFEGTLYREKDSEVWGFKDSVTQEQQDALRQLWAQCVAGTVTATADEVYALVRKTMGKPLAQKPSEDGDSQEPVVPESKPENPGKPEANTTTAERLPEVAPENPVECAKRMASLPYGRPDAALVWRNFGSHVSLSDADAAAFVQGLADAGRLQTLVVLTRTAVELSKKLAAAPKTAEATRAVA